MIKKVTEKKLSVYIDKLLAPREWAIRSRVKFTFLVTVESEWF